MTGDQLLKAIRARKQKASPFAYGILTADRYVKTLEDYIGPDACNRMASKGRHSYHDLLHKAARTLVYSNEDMTFDAVAGNGDMKGIETPKNVLMTFRHVLTSSRKDRDGDTLHADGAECDPKMLLLWQHVHTMPIGKMLKVLDQNPNRLQVVSCIVDMNELCHDAAVMVDNGMGRFSHGFRALEFTESKAGKEGRETGFDVTKFEIMEESLVSVPANVDAQTEEVLLSLVEGGKLTSPLMKRVGLGIREHRNVQVPGVRIKYRERLGDYSKELVCNSLSDLKTAADAGLIGGTKDENESGDRTETGTGQDSASPSEKADGEDRAEAEGSTDSQMTCPECGEEVMPNEDGECPKCGADMAKEKPMEESKKGSTKAYPSGSWEWTRDQLGQLVKPYLQLHGVTVGEDDWCYVSTMFGDHAIVEVSSNKMLMIHQYDIAWKMNGDKPEFVGDPKEVEITAAVESKSISWIGAKPFPNEHAARLSDPDKYEKIRRQNNKFGEGIHAIFGVLKDGKTELQSIHFDRSKFTAEEARKWLKDNDYKPTEFEEATGKSADASGEKRGRVLSSSNEGLIKEAMSCHDEILKLPDEHASKTCRVLVKTAHGHLDSVIKSLQEMPVGPHTQMLTAQLAMAEFLAKATVNERKHMTDVLAAIAESEKADRLVSEYRVFTGS